MQVTQLTLRDRGEAHITVVTPIEVQKISKYVSFRQIITDAHHADLDAAEYHAVCIGNGSADRAQVYFIVVHSDKLLEFRRALQQQYQIPGDVFQADDFYPHITLGSTTRDLHEQEGVSSNKRSCVSTFDMK